MSYDNNTDNPRMQLSYAAVVMCEVCGNDVCLVGNGVYGAVYLAGCGHFCCCFGFGHFSSPGAMNHDEDEVIIVGKKRSPIWESLCCHVIDLEKEKVTSCKHCKMTVRHSGHYHLEQRFICRNVLPSKIPSKSKF
jgi:hypothetical protein